MNKRNKEGEKKKKKRNCKRGEGGKKNNFSHLNP